MNIFFLYEKYAGRKWRQTKNKVLRQLDSLDEMVLKARIKKYYCST